MLFKWGKNLALSFIDLEGKSMQARSKQAGATVPAPDGLRSTLVSRGTQAPNPWSKTLQIFACQTMSSVYSRKPVQAHDGLGCPEGLAGVVNGSGPTSWCGESGLTIWCGESDLTSW